MENKTAEDQLRAIAEAAGMTLSDFHQLFNKAFIEDEKIRQRMIMQQQQELQYLQNQLNALQFRNETINNQLLTYELEQKVKEMNEAKSAAALQPGRGMLSMFNLKQNKP